MTGEQRLQVPIEGLDCAGSSAPLAARIRRHAAVHAADVNPVIECAFVRFDPKLSSAAAVFRALERELGPGVRRGLVRWQINLAEVGSDGWARRVEHDISTVIGVECASVHRHAQRLTIEFAPSRVDIADVHAAAMRALAGPSSQIADGEPASREAKTA